MDLIRLAKVWNLTTSHNPGEAAAAHDRARAIVEREGKTLADVPNLLRGILTTEPPKASPMSEGGFAGLEVWMDVCLAWALDWRKVLFGTSW
jgi:hypothetical protein